MASTVKVAGYFATIQDLSLTPDQERELENYLPMVRRVCNRFSRKNYHTGNDFSILDTDDLVQMALVKIARTIKTSVEAKNEHYYIRLVTRSCIDQIQCNEVRGAASNHDTLDKADSVVAHDDIDRIHSRLYIHTLLDSMCHNTTRQIFTHYYGLDTPEIGPSAINEILPVGCNAIANRHMNGLRSLRTKIDRGELPTWETG